MTATSMLRRPFAIFNHPNFLGIYSFVLTVAVVVALLTGFRSSAGRASFEAIDVQRINLREPDGTLRLVLSNNASFPGAMMFGTEYPHPARRADGSAGLLFFDNEGSESGGLIFGGAKAADGHVERFGHLSFDKYDQDQTVALEGGASDGRQSSSLVFSDQPDWSLTELLALERTWQTLPDAERKAREAAFMQARGASHRRAMLGRREDASSVLELRDAQGRTRLIARVSAEGVPTLQSLDEVGHVIAQWPQAAR